MIDLVRQHQAEIDQLIKEAGIKYLAVFGSHARGDARQESDIDLLVDYKHDVGLLHHADTQLKFEQIFGKKVDLATPASVEKYLRQYIENDLQVIYETT